jgi:hypothetical protein
VVCEWDYAPLAHHHLIFRREGIGPIACLLVR